MGQRWSHDQENTALRPKTILWALKGFLEIDSDLGTKLSLLNIITEDNILQDQEKTNLYQLRKCVFDSCNNTILPKFFEIDLL